MSTTPNPITTDDEDTMSKPTTPRLIRSIALDFIHASRTDNDYPRIVDRGGNLALVLATGGVLTRAAAEMTEYGAAHLLTEARRAIRWGVENGTTTNREASIGLTVLEFADPRREDLRVVYDRAEYWASQRDWIDTLDVIAATVDLLKFVASWTPDPNAFLDALAQPLIAQELAELEQ